MPVPVYFSRGYDATGSERELTRQDFAGWYGTDVRVADIRAWIQRKRNAAIEHGWTLVTDTADSIEVTKTVIETDEIPVVKMRRFFVR